MGAVDVLTLSSMHVLKLLPLLCFVSAEKWPELRTTFGVNPFGSAFASRPTTEAEARQAGWVNVGSCSSSFAGSRYMLPHDQSLLLMYDDAGYISGVQSTLLKSDVPDISDLDNNPFYQAGDFGGQDAYFTTAYFVDPAIICNGGRTQEQFDQDGLGDRLLIQNGPTPDDHIVIPMTQVEAEAESDWYDHFCFLGMGDHFIGFNYQPDQDCFKVPPVQILYDDGKIHGFVWQHIAFLPGDKWEHPDGKAIQAIVDRPPTCLHEYVNNPGLSTMHHYFKPRPWFTGCPLKYNRGNLDGYRKLMHF